MCDETIRRTSYKPRNKIFIMVWSYGFVSNCKCSRYILNIIIITHKKLLNHYFWFRIGEVSLHRLNWQRVWSLQPSDVDYTVSGMAWRPDGKVIAIGYSNGSLFIYIIQFLRFTNFWCILGTLLLVDVETKRILYTQRFSSISCVIWFNAPDLGVDSPIEVSSVMIF